MTQPASPIPSRKPPGPRPGWLLGNARAYGRDPLGFCLRAAREYGDVVRFRIFGLELYQINHPDLIEQVLVKNHHAFVKDRFTQDLKSVLGNGLLNSEGDFWRRQRRLAQPAFHHRRIESYGAIMVEAAERMLEGWPDGGAPRDVHADLMHLTMDIVARTLFAAQVGSSADRVGAAIEVVMQDAVGPRALLRSIAPRWMRLYDALPTPSRARKRAAIREVDDVVFPIIRERRESGQDKGDLLSMLIAAQDEDGTSMTDRQLRDEAVTLFLAGHETTALALTYMLFLLAGHPEAEARLEGELGDALGGRPPTVADLPKLRYTEWVVKESMRLYPPAWTIGREAAQDCELGGYPIPAGTQLLIVQWVMHRDPRYFEAPEEFRPERWEGDLARRLPRFAYFPFGGGPRICIGNSFAMLESILLLATIVQRFRLRVAPGYRLELMPSITMRPRHGLPMLLQRR